MTALLVALGAALGAALRYAAARTLDDAVPWGTLVVNLVGSFVLGALAGAAVDGDPMALLGTGLCGGLTTYSAFAVQTARAGGLRGTAYAAGTLAGCLLTATLGHLAAGTLS